MRRAGIIALLLLSLAAAAATSAAGRGSADARAARCGGQLWQLKTLSDPERQSVRLTSKTTTIGAIRERPYPRPVPRRRRTAFQRQEWQVVAQVTAFRLETGGLRLVLYDAGVYVNAVIPMPSCVRESRARAEMTTAWRRFATECGQPTREWQSFGAVVYVQGVGFWSQRKPRRGAAPNGAELHPVTGFRIVAGCRS
jgi:hypothetical protein